MSHVNVFSSFSFGPFFLPNRIVMAPMTRCRAGEGEAPTPMMAQYYAQRASAGLIVSEASQISPQGVGYPHTPGIYSPAQVAGWQRVTEAVHQAGGRIFLQLWHVGRISHPSLQADGGLPVAPSAIAPQGLVHTPQGKVPFVTPRALEISEIQAIVRQYGTSTRLAREAGFDGVELHGANGYLIDQFLRDGSNQRTDSYGGSLENRLRFLREVTTAACEAWSPERVGIRLSPLNKFNDMTDSLPAETFTAAAYVLNQFGLAYLHSLEALPGSPMNVPGEPITPLLRQAFRGPLMLNGGYDRQAAQAALAQGEADLIAFGVPFLANPDLPERLHINAPLNTPDMSTFYAGGERGYIDYPTLAQVPQLA